MLGGCADLGDGGPVVGFAEDGGTGDEDRGACLGHAAGGLGADAAVDRYLGVQVTPLDLVGQGSNLGQDRGMKA